MINITLTGLQNTTNFFDIDDVATIVNGRKRGYWTLYFNLRIKFKFS